MNCATIRYSRHAFERMFDQARPIHVVAARNAATDECHVVTVYVPDPDLWDATFKQRRVS
ncbi:MAG: hypothetical protein WAX67_00795 [Rugosibacter sp.]